MKKTFLVIPALGISAGMLTGCVRFETDSVPVEAPPATSSEAPSTQPSTEAASPAPESTTEAATGGDTGVAPAAINPDEFVSDVRNNTTTLYVFGDGKLKDSAALTCEKMNEGGDFKSIVTDLLVEVESVSSNVEIDQQKLATDLGYLTGAGVRAYCPEHLDTLMQQAQELAGS